MRIGFLDCFSGISGDMLLSALLSAGLDPADLTRELDRLNIAGFRLNISGTTHSSIRACRVRVQVDDPQPHRNLAAITQILDNASLAEPVRERALRIFTALAEAEARVHGCAAAEIHFHETGGLDTIIDVVGAVLGLRLLNIEKLFCSPLPLGPGRVRCDHGDLPLPAPAVCELLNGIPVYGETIEQELVTPTGAALIRVLAEEFGPMPPMRIRATGYGAGCRERTDGRPNLLRLIIGESFAAEEAQQVDVIETSLDDWSPETWPHVARELLAAGALDVMLIPAQMKKGRPGFLVRLVCDPVATPALQDILFRETSAIGLRSHRQWRRTLPREAVTVTTPWGPVRAKKIETPAGTVITPEYEECGRLARANDIPISRVYDAVRGRGPTPSGEE